MKTGTKVEVRGWDLNGRRTYEQATIARVTRAMLPVPSGYHPVRFADGGRVLVHESRIVVVNPKWWLVELPISNA